MKLQAILSLVVFAAVFSSVTSILITSGLLFTDGGEEVFLKGISLPHEVHEYGFGEESSVEALIELIEEVSETGANAIRFSLHGDGSSIQTDVETEHVTACDMSDMTENFANNIRHVLDFAHERNVRVNLVAFDAAALSNTVQSLFTDDVKMESYLQNCLRTVMDKIKYHEAFGVFEAVNEPLKHVQLVEEASEPCYDTSSLVVSGEGLISIERMLRSIGILNKFVHEANPDILTTVSTRYPEVLRNDIPEPVNFFSDECLTMAAGVPEAHVDFYQLIRKIFEVIPAFLDPLAEPVSAFQLDKPLVVEVRAGTIDDEVIDQIIEAFVHMRETGYAGVWISALDDGEALLSALQDSADYL